jgi:hypothetical protein
MLLFQGSYGAICIHVDVSIDVGERETEEGLSQIFTFEPTRSCMCVPAQVGLVVHDTIFVPQKSLRAGGA